MSLKKDIQKLEKQFVEEIKGVEMWMIQRRKFIIKLIWVLGFIGLLLILLKFI
jgi:hypothetical protein